MSHVAVAAVGVDRPGIVAAVTGVLHEHGCNLEDTSMTILRGHFAMMLVVDVPDGMDAGTLEQALAAPAAAYNLVVTVRRIEEDPDTTTPQGEPWTVSVYGADHPGIVHGVASLLAGAGVNIVDLTTRVIGEADHPIYAMVLEVTLPVTVDPHDLETRLARLGEELDVQCSLRPSEADIL